MDHVSPESLPELGDRFDIAVGQDEAASLAARVNNRLDALEPLDDLSIPAFETTHEDRSWTEPVNDPFQSIAVSCSVSSTERKGGLLHDIDVGVKDIVAVAGIPMTCGSQVMDGFVPEFDAAIVERILDAGASITAKTNLDEFAGSPLGTTGAVGPVRNPHDAERTAGGSSGGSAVAVATGRVDAAIGSDTGGSIRVPASFCGIVGMKPTYGLVPLHGVVENTYTQDHLGPMASDVETAARLLEGIAGRDERDPASLAAAGRAEYDVGGYVDAVATPPALEECTIAVLEEGLGAGVDEQVEAQFESCVDRLAAAGATIERVTVEGFEYGRAIKDAMSLVELATHWRAGGAAYRRGGVVDENYQTSLAHRRSTRSDTLSGFYRAKLLAGAHVVESANGLPYTRAQAAREVLREQFDTALQERDALALPTTPDIAPRLEDAEDPGFDYARNTRAADLTHLPAISLPGPSVSTLPVGFQLVGRAFTDAELLGVAASVNSVLRQ